MGSPVFHGSVVLRPRDNDDLEIDATHVGGFVRYESKFGRQITLIEHADLDDLLVALARLMPERVEEALKTAKEKWL